MQGTIFGMTEDYLLPCETASFGTNLAGSSENDVMLICFKTKK